MKRKCNKLKTIDKICRSIRREIEREKDKIKPRIKTSNYGTMFPTFPTSSPTQNYIVSYSSTTCATPTDMTVTQDTGHVFRFTLSG